MRFSLMSSMTISLQVHTVSQSDCPSLVRGTTLFANPALALATFGLKLRRLRVSIVTIGLQNRQQSPKCHYFVTIAPSNCVKSEETR